MSNGFYSATIVQSQSSCPCNLTNSSSLPSIVEVNDNGAVELGFKFSVTESGRVTGVKFYKATGSTGLHRGSLWTASGSLLAQVDFLNESATGWQVAIFDNPVEIDPGQEYVISYFAPNGRYSVSYDYFATNAISNGPIVASANVNGGGNGVFRYANQSVFPNQSYRSSYYWIDLIFDSTTVSGGSTNSSAKPLLLVTSNNKSPFTKYLGEILRAEGLNYFTSLPLGEVTREILLEHQVVLLGEATLTQEEADMFSTWVASGGNLVGIRPDPKLAGVFGLGISSGTLSEGYIKVNSTSNLGNGITGATMQYHGSADIYNNSTSTLIASLFSNATTSATAPAVTLRQVSGGGFAAAFMFDLARSVILTRQGNPEWAGLERDGTAAIRPDHRATNRW